MKITTNKRASDVMFLLILIALIMGLVFITIILPLFNKITNSSKESIAKGICGGMMAIRSKMTGIIVSYTVKQSDLFSLSPSCGNAYTEPCKQKDDCLTKIRRQVNYCWNITRNNPSEGMTCLYNLDINMSDTPSEKLCGTTGPATNKICPNTPECKAAPAPVPVKIEDIEFKDGFCARDKDSISMEYNGKKVIVKCQGQCK